MATDSLIPVTPGSGINLDTVKVTTGMGVVEREGVFIGDADNGSLRAGVTASGALKTDSSATTQPISGTVSVSNPGLTDAQLRASEVPVVDDTGNNLLFRILQMLMAPLGYDKSLQRTRGTVVIESGTVTTVSTITNAVPIGNVASLDGRNATVMVLAIDRQSWASSIGSKIT